MKSGLEKSRKRGENRWTSIGLFALVTLFLFGASPAWSVISSDPVMDSDLQSPSSMHRDERTPGGHASRKGNVLREKKSGERYKEGELLIKFKSKISSSSMRVLHHNHGAETVKEFPSLRMHHVKLKKDMSVAEAIALYQSDPDVEYAEPNYRVAVQATPNDPLFGQLWGLNNTGLDADIDAPEAWDITKGGSNVVVAVIDTGVDYNHQDLAVNIWKNTGEIPGNGIDDDGNGYVDDVYGIDTVNYDKDPFDDHGHGTHVSGTIGAVGNNGTGVVGVNWNIKIMACKFLNSGGYGYMDGAVTCLNYIKMMKDGGVNVVATNNSWGCDGGGCYSQALYDAINAQRDILFITAAGNASLNLDQAESYPAKYDLPNVIAVAAINSSDSLAYFSSFGKHWVHVGAPGEYILSTLPAANIWNISGGYGYLSGTSMATPHVTGLAGLLKAQDASRDSRSIKNLILYGSEPTNSLRDVTIMGGRINANNSVRCDNSFPRLKVLRYPETLSVGTPVTLSALSIRCGAASGPVTVTFSGGEVIDLHDDGVAPDLAAGDGIFSATWTPIRDPEKLVFSSPDAAPITITAPALYIAHYLPEANTRVPYHQHLTAVGAQAPYSWSLLSGSLPSGFTLNSSTGEISGNPVSTGTYSFTVQVSDGWGTSATRTIPLRVSDGDIREEFARTLHGDGGANGRDITLDASGNIHILGTLSGYNYIAKYDASGTLLWLKPHETGYLRAIALDGAGNIYAAGGTAAWDTGDTLLVKFDPAGNKVWEKTYNNGQRTDIAMDVALDGSGNIYLGGITGGSFTYSMYAQKISSSGNALWIRTYSQGWADYAYAVTVDGAGNVYIGGSSATGIPEDGGTAYWYDYVIRKYDTLGNLIWNRTYDTGARFDMLSDIKVDGNGNVYALGDPEDGAYTAFVTMKYSSAGDQLWVRNYKSISHWAEALAVDQQGNVYATGGSWKEAGTSDWDFLTLKYDPSGNLLWKKVSDGGYYLSQYDGDFANGIAVDNGGNVFVTGASNNGVGGYDMLMIKYGEIFHVETDVLPAGVLSIPYSRTLIASGGVPPYTWSITAGSLPPGLTLDGTAGLISGSPAAPGVSTFTVQVKDASAAVNMKTFTLYIVSESLIITTSSLPSGIAGVPYSQTLTATGGATPYTWSIISGSLPGGLSLNGSTGTISGTPAAAGTFNFSVQVMDANSGLATKALSIVVADASLTPDLIVSAVTVPTAAGAGTIITITDTTRNNGPGAAAASTTRFSLSTNSSLDGTDVLLGSRTIAGLSAGATSGGTTSVTIPTTTPAGTYYVIAKADGDDLIVETSETNNTKSGSTIKIGPDLSISALTAPGTAGAGTSITVTDTTKNSGAGGADPSTTRFYLSTSSTYDAAAVQIGSRSIGAIAGGTTSSGSTLVTIPENTVSGSYSIIARADDGNAVSELNEDNNTLYRSINIGPDLTMSAVTVPTAAGAGTTITINDTTKNSGPGAAGASTTRFYLSTDTNLDSADAQLGSRAVPGLSAGATSAGTTSAMIPTTTPAGTYYVIARADGDDLIVEVSETNNTKSSSTIKIGPDLGVSALTGPSTGGANASITVTDTTKNSGAGAADPSTTSFYLSTDTILDAGDTLLGSRSVGSLAAGATSQATTSVTIPADTVSGAYYIVANADNSKVVSELYEDNNTKYKSITIGPDLTVTSVTVPTTGAAGASITVTDTTKNSGPGSSVVSTTLFYLSTDTSLDGTDALLGSRTIPELSDEGTSSGTTTVTIPVGTASGTYYVIAKADGNDLLFEVSETNNTKYSSTIKIGPDLGVSSVSVPSTGGAGMSITVTDATKNSGAGDAGPSTTSFYLSTDTILDAGDTLLGVRSVTVLASGATSSGTTSVTLPATTSSGTYYVVAKADGEDLIGEVSETNNTKYSSTIKIGPDLGVSVLTGPSTGGANVSISVTDTTKNSGAGAAGVTTTSFYLSTDTILDGGDILLGSRSVGSLAAGATSQATTSVTIPADTASGAYYLIANADSAGVVSELYENNNTKYKNISIGPDLTVTSVTVPTTGAAGASITVSDTTKNNGPGATSASATRFYLSTDSIFDNNDTLLGSRSVPLLAAGTTSSVTTSVVLPTTTPAGIYYVIAKADGDDQIVETSETNNTKYSSTIKIGPDLTVYSMAAPSSAKIGATISITDTTKNGGAGNAEASITGYYLSTDTILDAADIQLGSRTVGTLAPNTSIQGTTSVTIPATTTAGTYYIIGKADAEGFIPETNETNNPLYKSISITAQ